MSKPDGSIRPEDMPRVLTTADLYTHWERLMGPLGFARRRLWIAFFDADGRVTPILQQIDDVPPRTDVTDCEAVLHICAEVLEMALPGGSVAVLYSRPGSAPVSEDDRSWARGLTRAAGDQGVRLWPVHFANDTVLRVFAPDDLVAPAA